MASWKNLSTYTYKDEAETTGSGAIKIKVQYDKDSMTHLEAKIRFEIELLTSAIEDTTDGYYILYNANNYPESVGRRVLMLKAPAAGSSNNSWIQNEDGKHLTGTITLSKEYNDTTFTVQDFWVCNVGKGTVSGQNVTYASGTKTFYEWFQEHGNRRSYAARYESEQLEGPVPTNVTKGTITITDNYNNTFTVKGTKGAAGDYNPVKSYSVTYGYDSRATISAPATPVALTITTPANATRTVWAKTTTKGTYGEDSVASTSAAIKQYVAPSDPGGSLIKYTKSKLTVKENWIFEWPSAKATNASSPVKGYRIRVYKNGSKLTGLVCGTGNYLSYNLNNNPNDYVDIENTTTSVTFNPEVFGFKSGDKVKLGVYAYTRNGIANTSGQLFNKSEVFSPEYTVENVGVAQVNINGIWKEGQVYVNVAGIWKEAEGVYTNVNGFWKESI